MKRILFSLLGTVAGLVGLLSFKTSQPVTQTGALPSAGLAGGSSSSPAPSSSSSSRSSSSGSSSSSSSSATRKQRTKTPSRSTASSSAATAAKSYTGSAITTQYGVVQVKVTVKGKTITNVAFVQLTAFDGRSQEINGYAGPQLLSETLSAQSAQIDTVSGATYTSDGYIQSLQSALNAAGI